MNLELMLVVAPIFLLIVLGHVLRRSGIPSIEFWNLNDKLVYWVLFPALLFDKTSRIDLSSALLREFAVVIYSGFAAAFLFALIAGSIARLEKPLLTSLLQGSARHNTFIALAVAERVYGPEGLAYATLIVALLVPITNVTIVTSMVTLLRGREGGHGLPQAIARDLVRNPFLIAIALGLLVNVSGLAPMPVVNEVAAILGGAALPIVLLCVGANIRVRAMVVSALPTFLAIVGKLVVFPFAIALTVKAMGMDPLLALVAIIFGAVPTAASSYTLARAMGGDAPAMAAIVTIQTAVSFLTLPLTLMLAQTLFAG
jgi:malonate transporter and related proteins